MAGQTTSLVSVRQAELLSLTGEALSGATIDSLSADGRYVLFSSLDNSLVGGDLNQHRNYFRRDLVTGEILSVSVNTNGQFEPTMSTRNAVMSADGRYAAWGLVSQQLYYYGTIQFFWCDLLSGVTYSTGITQSWSLFSAPEIDSKVALSPSDASLAFLSGVFPSGIYLRDLVAGTNRLVSLDPNFDRPLANPSVSSLAFSPDGLWLLFSAGFPAILYVRDLSSNHTYQVSSPQTACCGPGTRHAIFSSDSRRIAFTSAENIVTVHDLIAHTNTPVAIYSDYPSLSADGQLVAYETNANPALRQINLTDLSSGLTELISVNLAGAAGNGRSTRPLLTPDGRYVVFVSKASDLVENDTNGATDVFVRDRKLGRTLLVSMNRAGTGSGNGASSQPVLGADGRTVVFQSFASDLVVGDYNDTRDVFVVKLGADEEFTVLTLTPANGGGAKIIWNAEPGRTYRVQFKNNLGDEDWNDLPGVVVASASTASTTDTASGGQRFYRVRRLP